MKSGSEHEHSARQWHAWLAEHSPALLLYARQQTGSQADAEDLLQDAVLETWEDRGQAGPPPLWRVYRTIRHRAIDLARSRERRGRREAVSAEDQDTSWFDAPPEQRERIALIQAAMNALPAIHREVLTLKIWAGLTFAEIGEALAIPPNTAASRYRIALAELRKLTRETMV